MLRRMEKAEDEKREILREFISERGLKIARWAKDSGVDKNAIYNFLNSYSKSLSLQTYAKLARSASVSIEMLTGERMEAPAPTGIWVAGHVQAGDFREAIEWGRDEWYLIDVPVPARFRKVAKALEVRGNSMNQEFKPGAVVVWVPVLEARAPLDGDFVIVYSHCNDGMIEATVKQYREIEGKPWLWPKSDDPAHQAPIDPCNPADNVVEVIVVGLVVGDYKPRII